MTSYKLVLTIKKTFFSVGDDYGEEMEPDDIVDEVERLFARFSTFFLHRTLSGTTRSGNSARRGYGKRSK